LPYFTKGLQYLIDHKNLVIGALLGIASAALILMTPFSWIGVLVTAARIGIGLLIALFALIFEDINAYMHGQNSLIGDLEKRWPKVAAVIRAAFKWVSWEINAILHPLQTLQDILDYIVDKIKSIFGSKKELTINFNENTKKLIGAGANDTNSTIARFNALGLPTPVSKSNTVNVTGPITVNTQATDANGITQDMGKSLNNQLAQVNNHVDDGVMY
jgi:hypothetical protein